MREIQASQAKAHFTKLLNDVERGESVIITRHGRRIARVVPETDCRREEIERAINRIERIRKTLPLVTVEEILAWRDEGRE
jgi:prevent-host-death family protein